MKTAIFVGFVIITALIIFLLQRNYHKRLVQSQAELLKEHTEEVENVYRQMRGWRHDYKNHIQSMKAYLELNRLDLDRKSVV